jgi:hypothetical protein
VRLPRFGLALLCLFTATLYASPPSLPEGKNLRLGGPFTATEDSFTFGIIADRAGGNPLEGWPYFERAVREMNVLHPDFVLMPGDLIDGYIRREGPEGAARDFTEQYDEVTSFTKKLEMPLYFVPGNHDVASGALTAPFLERFGRQWYSFNYRGVHFIALCTEVQHRFTDEQVQWALADIAASKNARHTVIFMHAPAWHNRGQASPLYDEWLRLEEALNGRKYTVIAGHTHTLSVATRNGCSYYVMATSGGSQTKPFSFYEGQLHHVALAKVVGDQLFLSILDLGAAHTPEQVNTTRRSPESLQTFQPLKRAGAAFQAEFSASVVNPLPEDILAEFALEGLSPKGWKSSAGAGSNAVLRPHETASFRTVLTVSDPCAAYPPTLTIRAGNANLELVNKRSPAPIFSGGAYRTIPKWHLAAPFDGSPMSYQQPPFDFRRALPAMFRDLGPEQRTWNPNDTFTNGISWKTITIADGGRVDFGKQYGFLVGPVGYAVAFVDSPDERLVYLRFSANDYGRVFLNGEPVGQDLFSCEDGTVTFPAWLQQGANRFMVKTANWSLNWFFTLTVSDPERSLVPQ